MPEALIFAGASAPLHMQKEVFETDRDCCVYLRITLSPGASEISAGTPSAVLEHEPSFPSPDREQYIVPLAKRCYRELSGGQQQRVLLARALCATRKILLLDEPVSGLDPKVTVDMYELIAELNSKDGITVIMISHDISAAMKYATHILHIGKNVFFGTKEDYSMSEMGKMFDAQRGGEQND